MSTLKKKSAFNYSLLLKWLCVAAMVAYLACMFLPYYQYVSVTEESYKAHILSAGKEPLVEETRTISFADYLWMTRDHDDLFGDWSEGLYNWEGEQFQQNDLVMMPFLVTLLLIFGLIFFAAKKDSLWPAWFAVFGGGYATITYLQDKTGLLKPFSGNAPRYIIDDSNPLNITVEEIIKPFKGGMAYNVHLVLSVVILVLSLSILIPWFISVYRWFTVKKRHY